VEEVEEQVEDVSMLVILLLHGSLDPESGTDNSSLFQTSSWKGHRLYFYIDTARDIFVHTVIRKYHCTVSTVLIAVQYYIVLYLYITVTVLVQEQYSNTVTVQSWSTLVH